MKNDLMQYSCPNCGGNIDPVRLICEYCGTRFYRDEKKPVERKLSIIHSYVKPVVLGAQMEIWISRVNKEYKEEMEKEDKERLTWKFAEALMPYVEFDKFTVAGTTLWHEKELITGRLRVLPPGFKF